MTDKPKPTAWLNWSLHVERPHCDGDSIDLASIDSDNDYSISRHIFSGEWDKLQDYEVECPHCLKEFQLEKVEY